MRCFVWFKGWFCLNPFLRDDCDSMKKPFSDNSTLLLLSPDESNQLEVEFRDFKTVWVFMIKYWALFEDVTDDDDDGYD